MNHLAEQKLKEFILGGHTTVYHYTNTQPTAEPQNICTDRRQHEGGCAAGRGRGGHKLKTQTRNLLLKSQLWF